MKPREPLVINLNVDWRILAILLTVGALTVALYTGAGAQSGDHPTINDTEPAPTVSRPDSDTSPTPAPAAPEANNSVYTINSEWVPRDTVGDTSQSSPTANEATAQGAGSDSFYLTDTNYATDEALNACAAGYHMASLWEILDVSNLTYASDHSDAYIQDDNGSGPPASWNGWVRTGRNSSSSNTAGTGNCLAWTSQDNSHYGTAVQLSGAWESAPGEIGTWNAGAFQCGLVGPVWCVGD